MKKVGAPLAFAAASAVAVASGAAVLALDGASVSTWVRNPLSWVIGAFAALLIARLGPPRRAAFVIVPCIVVLLATFAAMPVQGVRRWVDVGPLHINAAALVLPPLLMSLAKVRDFIVRLAIVAVTGAILVLQPDASQASAFAAGSALLLYARGRSSTQRLTAVALCAAVAIATWFRPDSLEPVAEVEDIFGLAASISLVLAMLAAASLAGACLAPLAASRSKVSSEAAIALAAYFSVSALAPLAGAFPVPLVGLGMSFPLGWWLGVALAVGAPKAGKR